MTVSYTHLDVYKRQLNDILKSIEEGNNEIGIRAIFLYPMNALVNDQIRCV